MSHADNEHWFARFASKTATGSGRPLVFGAAGALVLGWIVSGPIFGFSDTWHLVMNTISSVVTFLMVFLIQNTQNRDSVALQLKLDELIRATTRAQNDLIGIEDESQPELEEAKRREESGKSAPKQKRSRVKARGRHFNH
jgi:low affinity Fe/Cu permease